MKLVFGGINSVMGALLEKPEDIEEAWLVANAKGKRYDALRLAAMNAGVAFVTKNRAQITREAGHSGHQGVLCRCKPITGITENNLLSRCAAEKLPSLLILEGIVDPRNLGASLRTGDACGVTGVVISATRSVGLTPAAVRSAAGSAHRVPLLRAKNLARATRRFKESGIWMVGLDLRAKESFYTLDCKKPIAFVFGSEGDGLRRLTRELCDYQVYLPMRKKVESLNVSVAAAICLYEMRRQRSLQ